MKRIQYAVEGRYGRRKARLEGRVATRRGLEVARSLQGEVASRQGRSKVRWLEGEDVVLGVAELVQVGPARELEHGRRAAPGQGSG